MKAQYELVIQASRGIGKKMVRTFPPASHLSIYICYRKNKFYLKINNVSMGKSRTESLNSFLKKDKLGLQSHTRVEL